MFPFYVKPEKKSTCIVGLHAQVKTCELGNPDCHLYSGGFCDPKKMLFLDADIYIKKPK
jgi:hypothetical protein